MTPGKYYQRISDLYKKCLAEHGEITVAGIMELMRTGFDFSFRQRLSDALKEMEKEKTSDNDLSPAQG